MLLHSALKTVNLHHVNFTSVKKQNTERRVQILLICLNSLPYAGAAEKMDQKDTPAWLQGVGASCPFPPGVLRLWAVLEPPWQGPAEVQTPGTTLTQSLQPVHTRLHALTDPPSALPSIRLSARQVSCQSALQLPPGSGSALLPGRIPSPLGPA